MSGAPHTARNTSEVAEAPGGGCCIPNCCVSLQGLDTVASGGFLHSPAALQRVECSAVCPLLLAPSLLCCAGLELIWHTTFKSCWCGCQRSVGLIPCGWCGDMHGGGQCAGVCTAGSCPRFHTASLEGRASLVCVWCTVDSSRGGGGHGDITVTISAGRQSARLSPSPSPSPGPSPGSTTSSGIGRACFRGGCGGGFAFTVAGQRQLELRRRCRRRTQHVSRDQVLVASSRTAMACMEACSNALNEEHSDGWGQLLVQLFLERLNPHTQRSQGTCDCTQR